MIRRNVQSPCRGMFVWDGYLVVIFNLTIDIFKLPETQDSILELFASMDTSEYSGTHHTAVYRVLGVVQIEDSLNIFIHIRRALIDIVKITKSQSMIEHVNDCIFTCTRHKFRFQEGPQSSSENGPAYCASIGSSGRTMAGIRPSNRTLRVHVPRLHVTTLRQVLEDLGGAEVREAYPSVELRDDHLPLLHFTSCMDFDDGLGILVLGSTEGLCSVFRFIVDCSDCIKDSLCQELPLTQTYIGGDQFQPSSSSRIKDVSKLVVIKAGNRYRYSLL